MHELPVADVYADVADVAASGVEAQQIAGLKLRGVHMAAVARLIRGNAVERVPELLVHVVHKS